MNNIQFFNVSPNLRLLKLALQDTIMRAVIDFGNSVELCVKNLGLGTATSIYQRFDSRNKASLVLGEMLILDDIEIQLPDDFLMFILDGRPGYYSGWFRITGKRRHGHYPIEKASDAKPLVTRLEFAEITQMPINRAAETADDLGYLTWVKDHYTWTPVPERRRSVRTPDQQRQSSESVDRLKEKLEAALKEIPEGPRDFFNIWTSETIWPQFIPVSNEKLPKSSNNRKGWCYDTLKALVEEGPLWDGDVPSKAGRDDLIDRGWAVRVRLGGYDGYTAATYAGSDLFRNYEATKVAKDPETETRKTEEMVVSKSNDPDAWWNEVSTALEAIDAPARFPMYRLVNSNIKDKLFKCLRQRGVAFNYTSVNREIGMVQVVGPIHPAPDSENICKGHEAFMRCTEIVMSPPSLQEQVRVLEVENERLRMQLVACGVVANANTPDSAREARNMHADYWSASVADVCRAVDAEIKYRETLKRVEAALKPVESNDSVPKDTE